MDDEGIALFSLDPSTWKYVWIHLMALKYLTSRLLVWMMLWAGIAYEFSLSVNQFTVVRSVMI